MNKFRWESEWNHWDLRAHNLDIRDFRLIFWFFEFLFILRGNQSESESEKNRAIEWVMTHGFRNSGSKIIEIPLRFCRIWRFLNEIQNMSGNQVILRFFSKFSSKMMPFFINTFKTKLSENYSRIIINSWFPAEFDRIRRGWGPDNCFRAYWLSSACL